MNAKPEPDARWLAADGPAAGRAQWEDAARASLKGRPLESLRGTSEDGLPLELMYWSEDLTALPHLSVQDPAAPPAERPGAWEIRQCVLADHPDPLRCQLEELAARGQRRLPLRLPESRDAFWEPAAFAAWLTGVKLGDSRLDLECGTEVAAGSALLAALPRGAGHRLIADWMSAGLVQGRRPVGCAAELAALWNTPQAPEAWLRVSGVAAHEAGASSAQELALWLAAWTTAVRELEAAGAPLEGILAQCEHELSTSRDLFESMARLRAARLLAARWLEAAGLPPDARGIRLGARGSLRHQTRHDPWVNLLRTSLAGFAAAAAGVDFLHLPTLSEGLGASDARARRLAANAQVILQDEVHLARVADPARGSWYVESLSAGLAQRAWELFQELETAGGYWAALAAGLPQSWIQHVRSQRHGRLAQRKESLVGTSAYPNLAERLPDWAHAPQTTTGAPADVEFPPLPPCRLARELEALRDRGRGLAANGVAPVWLATFGPLAQHKARADFSRGFLAVGGLPCGQDPGQDEPAAAAAAAFASGAAVLVLCSTDDSYPALVPPFVQTLRDVEAAAGRKPALVLLAGYPPAQLEALRAAGVQGFIHLKASLPDVLLPILQRLEDLA